MGAFLNGNNDGLTESIEHVAPVASTVVLAVFDGMGGLEQGEIAAFIAANTFHATYRQVHAMRAEQFLLEACNRMNNAINAYAKSNQIHRMGTTAAILLFEKKGIYICNIGDSRVYKCADGRLSRISHDHVVANVSGKKPPLSQHLGVPNEEFVIEPYLAKGDIHVGDRYLICSDGLTDMVSETEIEAVCSQQEDVTVCADNLMQRALDQGGIDNITIIFCEVCGKRKRPWK
jgi:protein phosphatase